MKYDELLHNPDYRAIFDNEKAQNIGVYNIENMNATIYREMSRPDPQQLYLSLWYEGELCCLYADTNLGKSILAVQIGEEIARNVLRADGTRRTVIYFDFELSDKQFQLRYAANGVRHIFPDTFMRATINREQLCNANTEDAYLNDIDTVIGNTNADVVIVDNLTWLCNDSVKGDEATNFMKGLQKLKFKYNLSMLVIAHTPKRDMSRPIEKNDLAGSRRLLDFFDSAFAIGQSAKDSNLRYIKQEKCRNGTFEYYSDNVLICEPTKAQDGFLYLDIKGVGNERDHLKEPSENDRAGLKQTISELSRSGKSYRDIAVELGISKSLVGKLLKNVE